MEYIIHSYRNAVTIFENDNTFTVLWKEVLNTLDSITEQDLIKYYNSSTRENIKSLSEPINFLIDERLTKLNWNRQSSIFNDSEYRANRSNRTWTMDFTKGEVFAVEVAFNHGGVVAWNMIKPVLSSELNHVKKAMQTKAGIIITATDELKSKGNFDNAIGSYAKYLQYLKPMQNILSVPLAIIGLHAPKTFKVNKTTKKIEML